MTVWTVIALLMLGWVLGIVTSLVLGAHFRKQQRAKLRQAAHRATEDIPGMSAEFKASLRELIVDEALRNWAEKPVDKGKMQ